MVISASTLNKIFTAFNVDFNKAFQSATPIWNKIAMRVPSTGRENTYGWLDIMPGVREWLGDRVVHDIVQKGYTIVNKDWEVTVGLKRNDVEDDQIGLYSPVVQQMGMNMAYHPDTLVYGLINTGTTDTGYDGVAFFSASHTWQKATKTNLTNLVLSHDNVADVRARLRMNLAGGSTPFMTNPKLVLLVDPTNEYTANKINNAETNAVGETNVLRGGFEVVVSPLITAGNWYLLVTNNPIMPIVFQERATPKNTNMIKPDDESVFNRKEYVYGWDARYNVGYGLWQLAYASIP